jgi:hypothetical protein
MRDFAEAIPHTASGNARRLLVRAVVRLRRRALDRALAAGADPWSSRTLMMRAGQLTRYTARRALALELIDLVAVTALEESPSAHLEVRLRAVQRQRAELLDAVVRLVEPQPVDVATIAQVRLLVRDGSTRLMVPADSQARTSR